MFYSAIAPAAYFIACFALFLNYWVDKYCLLRLWQVKSKENDLTIYRSTRNQLTAITIFHCIITLHYFTGMPFDYVAEMDGKLDKYQQCYGLQNKSSLEAEDYYPGIDLWGTGRFIFFGDAFSEYLSEKQRYWIRTYDVFVFVVVLSTCILFFGKNFLSRVRTCFYGPPTKITQKILEGDEGKGEKEEFRASDPDNVIRGYIPTINHTSLLYPQLAVRLPDWSEEKNCDENDPMISFFPRWALAYNEHPKIEFRYKDENFYEDVILPESKDTLFPICRYYCLKDDEIRPQRKVALYRDISRRSIFARADTL